MNWFEGLNSPQEVKNRYRELAMEFHPDKGGNTEVMQEINTSYHRKLESCDNNEFESRTFRYDWRREQGLADKIAEVITLEGVAVELCGVWVWVSGDTYQHRNVLKNAGFRFSRNKRSWYYHGKGYFKRGDRIWSMKEIRDVWGSETLKDEENKEKLLKG